MTTLLLVRHGQHDRPGPQLVGRDDTVRLAPQGEREVQALAERLAGLPIAAVLTSPARRCSETAAVLALPHALVPETDPDLDEVDFGVWRGRSFAELEGDPRWLHFNTARATARIPGGETVLEIAARVERAVGRIVARWPQGTVLAVSHGDVIRTACCWLLGLAPDLMLRFEVRPASVSVAEVGQGPPRLLAINWTVEAPPVAG